MPLTPHSVTLQQSDSDTDVPEPQQPHPMNPFDMLNWAKLASSLGATGILAAMLGVQLFKTIPEQIEQDRVRTTEIVRCHEKLATMLDNQAIMLRDIAHQVNELRSDRRKAERPNGVGVDGNN